MINQSGNPQAKLTGNYSYTDSDVPVNTEDQEKYLNDLELSLNNDSSYCSKKVANSLDNDIILAKFFMEFPFFLLKQKFSCLLLNDSSYLPRIVRSLIEKKSSSAIEESENIQNLLDTPFFNSTFEVFANIENTKIRSIICNLSEASTDYVLRRVIHWCTKTYEIHKKNAPSNFTQTICSLLTKLKEISPPVDPDPDSNDCYRDKELEKQIKDFTLPDGVITILLDELKKLSQLDPKKSLEINKILEFEICMDLQFGKIGQAGYPNFYRRFAGVNIETQAAIVENIHAIADKIAEIYQ